MVHAAQRGAGASGADDRLALLGALVEVFAVSDVADFDQIGMLNVALEEFARTLVTLSSFGDVFPVVAIEHHRMAALAVVGGNHDWLVVAHHARDRSGG